MRACVHEAYHYVPPLLEGTAFPADLLVSELLYADDTLIMDMESIRAEQYMISICELVIYIYIYIYIWSHILLAEARSTACSMPSRALIAKPDGSPVAQDRSVYLGAMLSTDRHMSSELSRRLGEAQNEFNVLSKIWAHSNLTVKQKVRIFDACVLSKLLYCLHTAWLNTVEL